MAVLGFIPGTAIIVTGGILSIVFNSSVKNDLKAADYYMKIMTISWGSGAEYGEYVYGWDDHPWCTINGATSTPYVKWGV